MKRTDLIALAERLAHAAEYVRSASPTLSEPDAKWLADQDAAVLLMRQIAESQPVAVRHNFDGNGWLYIDGGSGSDWLTRHDDAEPLYTLPLED